MSGFFGMFSRCGLHSNPAPRRRERAGFPVFSHALKGSARPTRGLFNAHPSRLFLTWGLTFLALGWASFSPAETLRRTVLNLRVDRGQVENYFGGVVSQDDVTLFTRDKSLLCFHAWEYDLDDDQWDRYSIPTDADLKFGIKDGDDRSGDYLVFSDVDQWNINGDWSKINVTNGQVCVRVNANTAAITNLFTTSTVYQDLVAEIQMIPAGTSNATTLAQFPVRVVHDIIQGTEGAVTNANPAYATVAQLTNYVGLATYTSGQAAQVSAWTAADTVVSNGLVSAYGAADTVVSNGLVSAYSAADLALGLVISNALASAGTTNTIGSSTGLITVVNAPSVDGMLPQFVGGSVQWLSPTSLVASVTNAVSSLNSLTGAVSIAGLAPVSVNTTGQVVYVGVTGVVTEADLATELLSVASLASLVTESSRIDTAEADIAVLKTNAVLKTGGSGITGTLAMTGRLTIGDTNRTGTLGYSTWLPDAGHIYNTLNRDSFLRNAKISYATGNTNVWDAGLLNNTAYGNGRDYQIYDRLAGTWAIRAVNNGPVLVQPEFVALGGLDGALVSTNLTGTIEPARLPNSNAARTALGLAIGTDVLAPDGDGSSLIGVTPSPTNLVAATFPASTNFTLAVVYAQSITLTADSAVIVPSVPTNRLVELQVDVNGADTYGLVWDPSISWLTDPPTGASVPVYLRRTTATTNWIGVAFQ